MIFVQINTINKKEEPLLSRTLINAVVDFENATPSYPEITSLIATSLKSDEKLIAVRHIYSLFGSRKAKVIAYAYNDEKRKQFIEPKLKEKKAKEAKKQ